MFVRYPFVAWIGMSTLVGGLSPMRAAGSTTAHSKSGAPAGTESRQEENLEEPAVRLRVVVDASFDPELASELNARATAALRAAGVELSSSGAVTLEIVVAAPPIEGDRLLYELRLPGDAEQAHREHACSGCSVPALVEHIEQQLTALAPHLRARIEHVQRARVPPPAPVAASTLSPAPPSAREIRRIESLEITAAVLMAVGVGGLVGGAANIGYAASERSRRTGDVKDARDAGYILLGVSGAITLAGVGVLAALAVARNKQARSLATQPRAAPRFTGPGLAWRF